MFDPVTHGWYVWIGVAAVSVAVAGVALSLPTAAPPTAGLVADAVDSVAASPHEARSTVKLTADTLRLRPRSVALRSDGGTATARFAFGPVVPVTDGPLDRVLSGTPPREAFGSRAAFVAAMDGSTERTPGWRPAPSRLVVRRVSWGEVDATLVG